MFPIVGLSLWMWTLMAFKAFQLWGVEKGPPGPLGKIPGELGISLLDLRKRVGDEEAVRLFLLEAKGRLEAHLRTIRVLAAVAPLLGLLGTVTGMITTFQAISLYGTGSPRALAVGISEALITTQSGLLVSILGLFGAGVLSRRARRCYVDLEAMAAKALQDLRKGDEA